MPHFHTAAEAQAWLDTLRSVAHMTGLIHLHQHTDPYTLCGLPLQGMDEYPPAIGLRCTCGSCKRIAQPAILMTGLFGGRHVN